MDDEDTPQMEVMDVLADTNNEGEDMVTELHKLVQEINQSITREC